MKITVGYIRKFSIGDYETLDLPAMITFDVPDELSADAVQDIMNYYMTICQDTVKEQFMPLAKQLAYKPKNLHNSPSYQRETSELLIEHHGSDLDGLTMTETAIKTNMGDVKDETDSDNYGDQPG